MELKKWNSILNEELQLNEGLKDVMSNLWKKVKGVKKQTIKKVADNFFKKHPDLLKAVKAKFGEAQTSEALEALEEASKMQKGLMTVAVVLALLSGMVNPAQASERISLTSGGETQTHYITNMQDALTNMEAEDFTSNLIGSYVIDQNGNYSFVNNQKDASNILNRYKGNYNQTLIFSEQELKGTGSISPSARQTGAAFQRHVAGADNPRMSQR